MTGSIQSKYWSAKTPDDRLSALECLARDKKTLPLHLVDDLLKLNLDVLEIQRLIEIVDAPSKVELEEWLINLMTTSTQELALTAFSRWLEYTEHILWHRIFNLTMYEQLPLRLRYQFIAHAEVTGGRPLLEYQTKLSFLDELSPAFHALLFEKSIAWNCKSDRLISLAMKHLESLYTSKKSERCAAEALAYLYCFDHSKIKSFQKQAKLPQGWLQLIEHLVKKPTKSSSTNRMKKKVLLWDRPSSTQEDVNLYFKTKNEGLDHGKSISSHDFAGFSNSFFGAAIPANSTDAQTLAIINALEPYLDLPLEQKIHKRISQLPSSNVETKTGSLTCLSGRLRFYLEPDNSNPWYKAVLEEQKRVLEGAASLHWTNISSYSNKTYDKNIDSLELDDFGRHEFIKSLLSRNNCEYSSDCHPFWALLLKACPAKDSNQLEPLTKLARQQGSIAQLAFIHALGKFKGIDLAVLKLLDYTRSSFQVELRALAHSLSGIGTDRALFELVHCLSRPNFSIDLRIEIAQLLSGHALKQVQDEIKATISDLQSSPSDTVDSNTLIESLITLVIPEGTSIPYNSLPSLHGSAGNSPIKSLDVALTQRIPIFASLSSEVKKALRTAEFFDQQIQNTKDAHTIDLSPLIDMQYKALELAFREMFEAAVTRVISTGAIQRQLDQIGYARPIPKQMDQFENYLAKLPTIVTIPYFSKFKMRKMLRSLCQFRPGKRFTLDGLKAFAIFFLVFSRKECDYALQDIFKLPFKSDTDLFEG